MKFFESRFVVLAAIRGHISAEPSAGHPSTQPRRDVSRTSIEWSSPSDPRRCPLVLLVAAIWWLGRWLCVRNSVISGWIDRRFFSKLDDSERRLLDLLCKEMGATSGSCAHRHQNTRQRPCPALPTCRERHFVNDSLMCGCLPMDASIRFIK